MRHRILWINLGLALVLVVIGVGAYRLVFQEQAPAPTGRTVAVQKGSVSETVTASGTVTTAGSKDLSFATNGTVQRVRVSAGDTVTRGQTLVTLDDTSAQQSLATARSSYVQAVSGAGRSTLSVQQAQQSVDQAKSLAAINKTSYKESVDTARRNLADAQALWSDACLDPTGTCPNTDAWAQLRSAEADVVNAKTAYDQAVQSATSSQTTNQIKLSQSQVNVETAQSKQANDCNTYGSDSTQCTSAASALKSAQQQYELQADAIRAASISAQQSLVNADAKVTQANVALKKLQASLQKNGTDAVTTAQQALDTALQTQRKGLEADSQSVQKAEQSLATARLAVQPVTAGGTTLTADQAAVAVARAGLASAKQGVADTRLSAPVAGTIGSVSVVRGDSVQAGSTVATILPDAPYEVSAAFSEADAAKLKVGQPATVTFDARPDATATGTVTAVDLEPTTSTGASAVTTYQATITLDSAPQDLLQGMSASVVVTVNEATDVLWLPSAAISTAGGQSTVTVRENNIDTVVVVQTGLAGDSGTEITSGLTQGQQVVIATSASTTGFGGFPIGGIPGGGERRSFTGGSQGAPQ